MFNNACYTQDAYDLEKLINKDKLSICCNFFEIYIFSRKQERLPEHSRLDEVSLVSPPGPPCPQVGSLGHPRLDIPQNLAKEQG